MADQHQIGKCAVYVIVSETEYFEALHVAKFRYTFGNNIKFKSYQLHV